MAKKKIEFKKRSRLLTGAMLKDFGACDSQRKLFRKLFGKGVNVTVKRTLDAAKKGLDVAYLVVMMSSEAEAQYYNATDKVWVSGGFKRREAALDRKYKRHDDNWYEQTDDYHQKYYDAQDAVSREYDIACNTLRAQYWINDPAPRMTRYG